MLAMEMASNTKFSYQRLRNEGGFDDDYEERERESAIGRARNWPKFRRVPTRKRFKLRVPSLRRFLRRRARLVSAVRVTCARVLRRLKESQAHFGDLFSGNYLFLQVNPTPLKSFQKNLKGHHDQTLDLASRYSVPRIA